MPSDGRAGVEELVATVELIVDDTTGDCVAEEG